MCGFLLHFLFSHEVSLNHLSPPLHAKTSPKINCQWGAQMKKYELKILGMSVYVCVHECIPPVFVLADVSHHSTLMQLFGSDGRSHVKTCIHTHTWYPVQYQCKWDRRTTLTSGAHSTQCLCHCRRREGEEAQNQQDSKRRKRGKDGSRKEGEGRGVVDTAHCNCYSPLQKMATSIKSLMIPALCSGSVGERGPKCLSERESGSDAEQRWNYGVSDGEGKTQGKTEEGEGEGKTRK